MTNSQGAYSPDSQGAYSPDSQGTVSPDSQGTYSPDSWGWGAEAVAATLRGERYLPTA